MGKKIFVFWIISGFSFQVWINTNSPTKTLDVNGDMRVRANAGFFGLNISYVNTTGSNGNLLKATSMDIIFSSRLLLNHLKIITGRI